MISRTSIFDNLRGYSMAINSVNNLETTDKADASKPPAKRWVYVIPVAVIMYMLAYLDRTNTAMILPYINSDTS
ncbi:MFS transporter, partial [Cutibacterium acnes]